MPSGEHSTEPREGYDQGDRERAAQRFRDEFASWDGTAIQDKGEPPCRPMEEEVDLGEGNAPMLNHTAPAFAPGVEYAGGQRHAVPSLLAADALADGQWGLSDSNPLTVIGTDMSNAYGKQYRSVSLRGLMKVCLLYTSPSPRDRTRSRMPSSA